MIKETSTKEKKHKSLTQEVANLFCTIGPDDVLFKEKDGKWYLGTLRLTPSQLRQYADEAAIIKSLTLWKELEKCIKYLANRSMFLKSETIDDMIAGKLVLFTLKNINEILDNASKLVDKDNQKRVSDDQVKSIN